MALGGKGKGKRVPKTVRHQRNANAWDHWKAAVNNPELMRGMRGLVIRDRNSTIKDNSSTSYIGMVRRLTSVIYNVYPELIRHNA